MLTIMCFLIYIDLYEYVNMQAQAGTHHPCTPIFWGWWWCRCTLRIAWWL